MSPFVVGILIVSVGTSLPELVASLISVQSGTSEIVAGNVLGANATNLLLILGVVSIVTPGHRIVLGEQYLFIDLHYMLGSMILLGAVMMDGLIGRAEGMLLLAVYGIYIGYQLREGRTESAEIVVAAGLEKESRSIARDVGILVLAGAAIFVSGNYTVDSLEAMSASLGISPAVASATFLSVGTTLPELAVSATAARRGLTSLAMGNIMGSIVFNALVIAGSSAAFGRVEVPATLLHFALPYVIVATMFFYLLTQDKRISRWEGMLMLALFTLYLGKMAGAM